MGGGLEQAERDLAQAIAEERIILWGRPNPQGRAEPVPADQFRIPGMIVIVDVFGEMATRPVMKRYDGPRWGQIEFDPTEIRRVWPTPSQNPAVPQSLVDWMHTEAKDNLRAGKKKLRSEMVRACMAANGCTKLMAEAAHATLPDELRFKRGRPKRG
jgi:hypothetical protein